MPQRVTQTVAEVATQASSPRVRVTQSLAETAFSVSQPEVRVYQAYGILLVEVNAVELAAAGPVLAGGLFPQGTLEAAPPPVQISALEPSWPAQVFGAGALAPRQDLAGTQPAAAGAEFPAGSLQPEQRLQGAAAAGPGAAFGSGQAVLLLQDLQPGPVSLAAWFGAGMVDLPQVERGAARVPLAVEWLRADRLVSGWTLGGSRIVEPVYFPVLYFSGREFSAEFLLRSTAWRRSSTERIELLELHAGCDPDEAARMVLEEWPEQGGGISVSLDDGRQWHLLRRDQAVPLGGLWLGPSDQVRLRVRVLAPAGLDGALRATVRLSLVWRAN